MPEFDEAKIREYYHSISELKSVFDDVVKRNHGLVQDNLVVEYERLLEQAQTDLPELLRGFNKDDYFSHDNGGSSRYYHGDGIMANIGRNLSILKVRLDADQRSPVTESKSFHFIADENLRSIIERDYQEVQRSIISKSYKSAIVLSGGLIESILLDVVSKNEQQARGSSKAPTESDTTKWDLNDLIEVVVDLELVNSAVATLSHSVRKYRNLIHPGVELRTGLKVEPEEANIAVNVLNILIRELS